MKTLTLFEIFIVLFAYKESILLGFLVMVFVFIAESNLKEEKQKSRRSIEQSEKAQETLSQQNENTKQKLLAMIEEKKILKAAEDDFTPPAEMPKFIINYANYMIEDYGGWYIVLYPDMKPYPKLFNNIEHAKKIIDNMKVQHANT